MDTPPFRLLAAYFHGEQTYGHKLASCNSLFAIIHLAASGHGVALVPRATVLRELAEGKLVVLPLDPEVTPMRIVASWQTSCDRRIVWQVSEEIQREIQRFFETTGTGAISVP